MFAALEPQHAFKGTTCFRAHSPKDRARTVPVTALPFLAGAGVLPTKWGEPESKAYIQDVATNAHPFRFVSPKNFGDEALANAARTCLKKEWGRASKTRYQQSGRVVSLRSLLLALKHKNSTDPELFRSLTLHTEALERVCADLDMEDAKKKRDAAMAVNKKIAGSIANWRSGGQGGGPQSGQGNGQGNNEGTSPSSGQRSGQVGNNEVNNEINNEVNNEVNNEINNEVKKRPQLKMKQPRCALVTAVEAYMTNLCELKLDTAVIPKEIGECSVLHTMTPKQRKVTCVAIMKRVADHGINTGRLGADMKDASVFFRSPELPQMIEEFVQVSQ